MAQLAVASLLQHGSLAHCARPPPHRRSTDRMLCASCALLACKASLMLDWHAPPQSPTSRWLGDAGYSRKDGSLQGAEAFVRRVVGEYQRKVEEVAALARRQGADFHYDRAMFDVRESDLRLVRAAAAAAFAGSATTACPLARQAPQQVVLQALPCRPGLFLQVAFAVLRLAHWAEVCTPSVALLHILQAAALEDPDDEEPPSLSSSTAPLSLRLVHSKLAGLARQSHGAGVISEHGRTQCCCAWRVAVAATEAVQPVGWDCQALW